MEFKKGVSVTELDTGLLVLAEKSCGGSMSLSSSWYMSSSPGDKEDSNFFIGGKMERLESSSFELTSSLTQQMTR